MTRHKGLILASIVALAFGVSSYGTGLWHHARHHARHHATRIARIA